MNSVISSVRRAVFNAWRILTAFIGFATLLAVVQFLLLLFIVSMRFEPDPAAVREHTETTKGLTRQERALDGATISKQAAVCFDTTGRVSVVCLERDAIGIRLVDNRPNRPDPHFNSPPHVGLGFLNFPHCQLQGGDHEIELMLSLSKWPTPALGTDHCGKLPKREGEDDVLFQWDACRQVWSFAHRFARPFAHLGRNGLTRTPERTDRLGQPQWVGLTESSDDHPTDRITMATRHAVFDLDLAEMTTTVLFEDRDRAIVRVRSSGWTRAAMFSGVGAYSATTSTAYRPLLTLYTADGPDRLLLRDPSEQITLEPRGTDGQRLHGVYAATRDGLYFLHRHADVAPPDDVGPFEFGAWYMRTRSDFWPMVEDLYRIAPDGSLSPVKSFRWRHGPDRTLTDSLAPGAPFVPAITAVSPLVFRAAIPYLLSRDLRTHFYEAMRGRPERASPFLCSVVPFLVREFQPRKTGAAVLLTAISCLLVVALSRRRMRAAGTLFWVGFVAAFNVSGLLTFLCLSGARLPACPACGKTLTRRGTCAKCGAGVLRPEDGKPLFAPGGKGVPA